MASSEVEGSGVAVLEGDPLAVSEDAAVGAVLHGPQPTEWRETEVEDERFLPTLEAEASEIVEGLWLGSEANVVDVVWLKVQKITCIVTINSSAVDPVDSPHVSESLKLWFKENVKHVYWEALDTPTQMVTHLFQPACEMIGECLDSGRNTVVHCGRGISRSATLVIATLMHRKGLSYTDALGLVSSKRPCVYPNVGFQLQLCLFEKMGFEAANCASFDAASEIAVSIQRTLVNVEDRLDAVFHDGDARHDPSRWMDFGFFFQNCREYLGHIDIGLPLHLLAKADDVARRLRNLEMVFQGAGISTAARVGRVMDTWQSLQAQMAAAPGALPRIELATYVSVLANKPPATSLPDDNDRLEPAAKRHRAAPE